MAEGIERRQERKFAHEPIISKQKGRFKLCCRCGAQAALFDSAEEALLAYSLHVGLKELKHKELH